MMGRALPHQSSLNTSCGVPTISPAPGRRVPCPASSCWSCAGLMVWMDDVGAAGAVVAGAAGAVVVGGAAGVGAGCAEEGAGAMSEGRGSAVEGAGAGAGALPLVVGAGEGAPVLSCACAAVLAATDAASEKESSRSCDKRRRCM